VTLVIQEHHFVWQLLCVASCICCAACGGSHSRRPH